ncbi:MAG: D-2-hydroxyacid dehydrogenase [Saccharofermentans sp.]|nr:D-2-hydroxyacid dehydrogenase [Saccharofermentans sp.]
MKTVILDGSAANPGDISWGPLEKFGELTVYDVTTPEQVVERSLGAEILITNKTAFTEEIISKLPDLKYIGVLATGFNVVDLQACSKRGITVTNVPEYSTFATAQMTVALLLELTNNAGLHNASVMDGDWVRSPQFCYWKRPLTELWNKEAVVFGYGKIGKRVAQIFKALGMNVTAVPHHMPKTREEDGIVFKSKEEAFKNADIISLHSPLTDETKDLINKNSISELKDGVIIINAARGPLVNEADMAEALRSGKVSGYAADVVSVEPMREDNPLLNCPNTILTPHTAWAPKETRERLIAMCAQNIESYLNGNPINKVN